MDPDLERVLRALEDATAFARSYRFDLDAEYLALIAAVESLPENQSGARKSSRWLGSRAEWQSFYAGIRRIPRVP